MAITYTWNIASLDVVPTKTIGGVEYTDVIKTVHWRLRADEGDYTAGAYGAVDMDTENVDANTFVQFSELTAQTIVSWAAALINDQDEGRVAAIKAALEAQIEEQKVPKTVQKLPATTVVADSDL